MIRDKDFFVELAQRSEIANNIKPDAFVSIHHNASLKEEIRLIKRKYKALKDSCENLKSMI